MAQSRALIVGVAAALGLAASCAHPQPQSLEVAAMTASQPPAPRSERAGRPSRPDYVWLPGYWNYVNERFVWVPGYWTVPPSGKHAWQAPSWHHDKDAGWVLVKGYWY
jgi:hypothetical protein